MTYRFFHILALALLLFVAPFANAQEFDRGPELDGEVEYYAVIRTNMGEIPMRLLPGEAPDNVRNFVNLAEGTAEYQDPRSGRRVRARFYDGTTFHKVVPDFMIIGGDPTASGHGGPGYSLPDEIPAEQVFDTAGMVAMANSGPNTNRSQFFITEKAANWLNGKYTVVGKLLDGTNGLETVKKIARVERTSRDAPKSPVTIERVDIHRLEKGLSDIDAFNRMKGLASPTPPATPAATPAATPEPSPSPVQ